MNNVEVLVLHGSPGSGKTTVAEAIAERMRQQNVASALIDLDALNIVTPEQGRHFSRANLRAVWPNYAAVPNVRVVLPVVVVDRDDLAELKEITAPARFIVCELTAPRDILEARVVRREPNHYWRTRLVDLVALYHRCDHHPEIRDFQVATHPGSVQDAADDVLRLCGWTRQR
jgi:adenylylsulfate kinase-like enzyme